VLSAVVGVLLSWTPINLYVQIGLVVLVGLACKNAILIIEFARGRRADGLPADEAVLEACRLRFRPILMTSLALILGVVPLVFAWGAGAEMRRSLGLTVFSGMMGVTFFGVFLTPLFFSVIDRAAATRWLASPRARRRVTALLAGTGGVGAGFLLAELAGEKPARALLAGVGLGAALMLMLLFRRWLGNPRPIFRGRSPEMNGGGPIP
jgi:multidrug efflux pump